jgi:ABC-type lipoprotein export system ATPase subunit
MEMAVDFNTAIVLVTHDLLLAKKMKKIYYLSQGKLVAS